MPKVTQKSVARHGAAFAGRVDHETHAALLAEAKRINRSVSHVAGILLRDWYELDYLPAKAKKKGTP